MGNCWGIREGRGRGCGFWLNRCIGLGPQFGSMDGDVSWRVDTNTHFLTANINNDNFNVIANEYAFVSSSWQHKHGSSLLPSLGRHRLRLGDERGNFAACRPSAICKDYLHATAISNVQHNGALQICSQGFVVLVHNDKNASFINRIKTEFREMLALNHSLEVLTPMRGIRHNKCQFRRIDRLEPKEDAVGIGLQQGKSSEARKSEQASGEIQHPIRFYLHSAESGGRKIHDHAFLWTPGGTFSVKWASVPLTLAHVEHQCPTFGRSAWATAPLPLFVAPKAQILRQMSASNRL
jgi:hypothetical protein